MKKRVIVLSLGGSLIIPDDVDFGYLTKFKKTLLSLKKKYKFVVVCGGGSIARKYISALKKAGQGEYIQSLSGIGATRMNARFMSYFFGEDPKQGISHDMREVKNQLRKDGVVFCGALRYAPHQTSDSTAVKLARYLKTDFINLTNVDGLYTDNPLKNKKAKFIPETTFKDLYKRASKRKYKPGQHFVIDQTAAKIIYQNKIKTYIIGKNLENLKKILNKKKFRGTIVKD